MSRTLKILIAIAAALVAAIVAFGWLSSREAALISRAAPVQVVIAADDIPPGEVLTESDLSVRQIPQAYAQPGTFSDPGRLVNRLTVAGILQGEQITAGKVVLESDEPLSSRLPAGRRAVTVPVNPITGVSNLIRAGDHVDLVGVFQVGESTTEVEQVAQFVFQDVLVVAIGQQVTPEAGGPGDEGVSGYSEVTLAMTPEEAAELVLALDMGTLTLLLRSSRETEAGVNVGIITPGMILGSEVRLWNEARQEAEFRRRLLEAQ